MNARTNFPQLPLGGLDPHPDRAVETPPVEGQASSSAAIGHQESLALHPDYVRLFGVTRPDQAITEAPLFSPGASVPCGSPPALCDPTQAVSHPLYHLLAERGHPSARALADIADLRSHHLRKGHTPQADAARGWVYFKRVSDEAFRAAIDARSPETRRKRLIIAVAILVAMIDAEDFSAQQQEPPHAPDE